MRVLRRPAAALAAALLGVLAVVLASVPAYAVPAAVKFKTPADQEVVTSGTPTVQAFIYYGATGPLGSREATLVLRSLDNPDREAVRVEPDEPIAGGICAPVTFTVPRLVYNGRYEAAIESEVLGRVGTPSGDCAGASDASREFFVAAPPLPPSGLKGSLVDRSVLLRWNKNPEGDVEKYRVLRAKGNGDFEPVGETNRLFFGVNPDDGGDHRFAVIALRKGAKAGDPLLESPLSQAFSVNVPPPPAPPVVPGAVNRGARRPAVGGSSSRPRTPVTRDTGFRQTLPFAEAPTAIEEGEEEAVPPAQQFQEVGIEEERTDNKRNLAVLAAGLLVTVLVMHLLWVKGEVDREPLEAIGPE